MSKLFSVRKLTSLFLEIKKLAGDSSSKGLKATISLFEFLKLKYSTDYLNSLFFISQAEGIKADIVSSVEQSKLLLK